MTLWDWLCVGVAFTVTVATLSWRLPHLLPLGVVALIAIAAVAITEAVLNKEGSE